MPWDVPCSIHWEIMAVGISGVQAVEVETEVGLQAAPPGEELGPCPACLAQQLLQERSWVHALRVWPSSSSQEPGGSRMDGTHRLFLLLGQKSGVGGVNCTVCYLQQAPLALESSSLLQPSGPWSLEPPWPGAEAVWG